MLDYLHKHRGRILRECCYVGKQKRLDFLKKMEEELKRYRYVFTLCDAKSIKLTCFRLWGDIYGVCFSNALSFPLVSIQCKIAYYTYFRQIMANLVDEHSRPHREFKNNKYPYVKDRIKFLEEHIDCFQKLVSLVK